MGLDVGDIVVATVGLDVVGEVVGFDVGDAVVGLAVDPPVGLAVGGTVGVDSKLVSSSGLPGLSCRLQAACDPKSALRPRNSAKGSARVSSKAHAPVSAREGARLRRVQRAVRRARQKHVPHNKLTKGSYSSPFPS